jgi:hypothetical protein
MASSRTVNVDEVLRRSGDLNIDAFKVDNFDVTGYVSEELREKSSSSSVSQEVKRLDQGIEALSHALKGEIVSKFESLIKQVACVDETGSIIASVKEDVKGIHQITKQLTTNVKEPQRRLKQVAKQLRSTRNALNLVTQVSNYLKLVKKLKDQVEKFNTANANLSASSGSSEGEGGASSQEASEIAALGELAKAAKLLRELRQLQKEEESLGRIIAVANHAVWVEETWRLVSSHAKAALRKQQRTNSATPANYSNAGHAFQVYFNLGELDQVVESTLSQHTDSIAKSLEFALTHIGANQTGSSKDGQSASNALLANFDNFLSHTLSCMIDVWQMQRVLSSKFDPVKNTTFLEACSTKKAGFATDQSYLLTTSLWNAICSTLSGRLGTAFYKSISLKNALVGCYPDLARALRNFVLLLQKETTRTSGVSGALPNFKTASSQLIRCVESYQNAFQAMSLNRMIEAVNILFTQGSRSLPTSSDMKRSIKCFFVEIQRCTTEDGSLVPVCIANVAKAVRLMKERAELLMATGAEVKKVSGACSAQQQRNIALCCRIQEVYTTLSLLLSKLEDTSAKDLLLNALESLKEVSLEAVAPIFRSMLEMLEETIVHIQEENFTKRGDGSSDMSIYLSDLLMKISHCRTEYLSKFKMESSGRSMSNEMVNGMIKKLAARVLDFYAKHASLIRPLESLGMQCLAKDMKQIESAIEKALCPLESLGQSHTSFRSLALILTKETEEELTRDKEAFLSDISPEVLVHHLFSRMPASVQSPQEKAGLSVTKYVTWMEKHSTVEVLQAAGDAIQAAEAKGEALPLACSIAKETIDKAKNAAM